MLRWADRRDRCIQKFRTSPAASLTPRISGNMCVKTRANTTETHAARWPDRPKPVHSEGSGKTGCEVITGHCVWGEKSCNKSEKCSDMCSEHPDWFSLFMNYAQTGFDFLWRARAGWHNVASVSVSLVFFQVSGREEMRLRLGRDFSKSLDNLLGLYYKCYKKHQRHSRFCFKIDLSSCLHNTKLHTDGNWIEFFP